MNWDSILWIGIVAAIGCVIITCVDSFISIRSSIISVDEDGIDEERTLCATNVIHVLQYWLRTAIADQTTSASSMDNRRSYFQITTTNGHLVVCFDWSYKRVYFDYSYHVLDQGDVGYIRTKLRIRHNTVDELKVAEYAQKIAEFENELLKKKVLDSDEFKNYLLQVLHSEGTENGGE